ncbi:MAG: hypothetical protein ACR2HG_12430 [Pyrinomonadaceae bacterium]
MFKKLHYLSFGIFLFALSSVVFSQNSTNNAQVRLTLNKGKTVYRMGEPIQLILVFTSQNGEYNFLTSSEETVNTPDEVILSPGEGAFSWRAQYERGKYFMNDHFGYTELSAKPINIELDLNDFYRFDKAGKYSVYVKTKRVFASKGKSRFGGDLIPLISNTVEFEVVEMSDAEEREEIKFFKI